MEEIQPCSHVYHVNQQDEEEAAEALSLRDLLLDDVDDNDDNNGTIKSSSINNIGGTGTGTGTGTLFEFYSDSACTAIAPADDIIFSGKLVPFKNPVYRRSESEGSKKAPEETKVKMVSRKSRSLDYRKKSDGMESFERSSSSTAIKPRWYWYAFMFGKFPATDMSDIKSRQLRNNSKVPATRQFSSGDYEIVKDSSYKIIRVLSCKDHASVAVMASFSHKNNA